MKLFRVNAVDFAAVASRLGFGSPIFALVNGKRCQTKQSMFDEWHAALRMPNDPDRGWDAFHDSLSELFEWLGTTEIVILVTSAESVLADLPPDERPRQTKILLEVLRNTTGEGMFVDEPHRLDLANAGVLFVADHGRETQLDQFFRSVGFDVPAFK